jgi:hypothetical protein
MSRDLKDSPGTGEWLSPKGRRKERAMGSECSHSDGGWEQKKVAQALHRATQ